MDVSFTLWSLKEALAKIPFDGPPGFGPVDLDFSKVAAPHYVKEDFKVSFIYENSLPYEACCAIYFPENAKAVTIVIIMNQKYEASLEAFLNGDRNKQIIEECSFRREIYCHEACHLTGIIRAYPSDRSSKAKEDFIAKIKDKFVKSVNTAEDIKSVLFSKENLGESPSVFDKDHFRYGDDNLNYFDLYKELMFPYDKMIDAIEPLREKRRKSRVITFDDVEEVTLVSKSFFNIFPEKIKAFEELLAERL